ncbi:hypothetical protein [Streptomyces ureilyticus]|uniref:Uncharacterized protein n=1 Tax=Streptomyces ureilyticus TaxID=1775131 RepID=A0ABX0DXY8_9ACTN|nr:hypothetical protein [Streptomyces ureilyticus]NGO45764.1 hypothetical protein [Streptomyces ureilyticus]
MTRPAVRMCARCHRTTNTPVLVHEVHAATGPGFNVYACTECADHYPSMSDPLELAEPPRRRARLTLRVYKVNAQGAVTEDRGKVEVLAGGRAESVPRTWAFPPCECPRCRTGGHNATQATC